MCHQASLELGMEGLRRAEEFGGTAAERLRTALQYFIEHTTESLKGYVLADSEGEAGVHMGVAWNSA
mgnify:CR=1 FL=1